MYTGWHDTMDNSNLIKHESQVSSHSKHLDILDKFCERSEFDVMQSRGLVDMFSGAWIGLEKARERERMASDLWCRDKTCRTRGCGLRVLRVWSYQNWAKDCLWSVRKQLHVVDPSDFSRCLEVVRSALGLSLKIPRVLIPRVWALHIIWVLYSPDSKFHHGNRELKTVFDLSCRATTPYRPRATNQVTIHQILSQLNGTDIFCPHTPYYDALGVF